MNDKEKSFIGFAILDEFHRIYCSGDSIDNVLRSFSYHSGRLNVVTIDDLVDACGKKYKLVDLYAQLSNGDKIVARCSNCGTADNPGEKCNCGRTIK